MKRPCAMIVHGYQGKTPRKGTCGGFAVPSRCRFLPVNAICKTNDDAGPVHCATLRVDLLRFDGAPLSAFAATKRTGDGTGTDGRMPLDPCRKGRRPFRANQKIPLIARLFYPQHQVDVFAPTMHFSFGKNILINCACPEPMTSMFWTSLAAEMSSPELRKTSGVVIIW